MDAYRLRHRVTFWEQIQQQDPDSGEIEKTWSVITGKEKVPAEVLLGAGKESFHANAKQADVDARINTRWFPADLMAMAKWRITWEGCTFDIIGPPSSDATGRRDYYFQCTYGLNDGN